MPDTTKREAALLGLLDHLRYQLAEIDCYAHAAAEALDHLPPVPRHARRERDRMSFLLQHAAETAEKAIQDFERRLRGLR